MSADQRWLNSFDDTASKEELRDELNRLEDGTETGEIDERDRDRILTLAKHEAGKYKATTVRGHVGYLRTTAQRGDTPLVDHNLSSITALLDSFRNGAHPDVKDGGIGVRNYQKALRVFYRFHDDLGIDDPMDIELDEQQGRDLSPNDLLTQEDVDALLSHTPNLRDRAFLTLALATGQRLDAIRTLRIKHVESDGRTMDIRLNEREAALKGASGTRPLLWAKHYVRDWYENHPYRDDPEAALFCPLPDSRGLNDPNSEEREPLHKESWRGTLKRMAKRAGLEKKIYPHLLRHTAITRMVIEGLSEQKIKRIVGWGADSSQFETYVTLANQLTNDSIREDLGLPTSEEEIPKIGRPTLERCPDCNDQLPPGSERCQTCQTPLTQAEAEEGGTAAPDPREQFQQFLENHGEEGAEVVVERVIEAFTDSDEGSQNESDLAIDSDSDGFDLADYVD